MRLTRPVSTLPAPTSTKRSTPCAGHEGDALAPAHRAGDLATRPSRIASGSVTGRPRRWRPAAPRARGSRRRRGPRHGLGGGPHEARNGRARRPAAAWRASRPCALAIAHRPLDRRLGAGDHDLAAAVVVGRPHRPRPARLRAATARAGRRNRGRAAPPSRPRPTGTAFCMASPRRRRSRAVSAMVRRRPRQSAEYSPSEWPATKAASRARSSRASASQHADRGEAHGHQGRLGVGRQGQLGLGPLEHRAESFCDEGGIDLLEHGAGRGKASASALPMPTAWLPWPGKMKAVLMRSGPCGASPPCRTMAGGFAMPACGQGRLGCQGREARRRFAAASIFAGFPGGAIVAGGDAFRPVI